MKVLRFHGSKQEWSVPLPELSADMKRMLALQWREFVNEIVDREKCLMAGATQAKVIASLERLFGTADSAPE